MIPPDRARQVIVEACGRGPQSIPMLAAHMLNAGEHVASIYATVRIHLPGLVSEKRVEEVKLSDGAIVYRLPAKTPMEPKKEPAASDSVRSHGHRSPQDRTPLAPSEVCGVEQGASAPLCGRGVAQGSANPVNVGSLGTVRES